MRRVVLVGPSLAGKRTAIGEFASVRSTPLYPLTVPDRDDPSIQNVGVYTIMERAGHPIRIGTLSGAVWNKSAWSDLISSATVIGLVLDSQNSRIDANCEIIDMLDTTPVVPRAGCVIWTKQDLTHHPELNGDVARRLRHSRCADWPIFPSSHADKSSMLKAIDWLIDHTLKSG